MMTLFGYCFRSTLPGHWVLLMNFVLFGVPSLRPHNGLFVWCTFFETTQCFLVYLLWDHTMFCVVWCTFSETTQCFVLFGVPSLRPHNVLCCLVYLLWDHTMFCVVWCTFSETTQCFVLFGVPSLRPHHVLCCLVYHLWDHTMFCVVWCTFSETTPCFVLFDVPSLRPWGGWGCEVSCDGHHRPCGKTTMGSALDEAVFDIAQILAYLVHNMSRSQLYLRFGRFGWLPSFFGQKHFGGLMVKLYFLCWNYSLSSGCHIIAA